ncbi:hypothetical protein [Myxococcus stipitatus]|uniref:hypothetical protein n=1 Tax=Myxococcus stipitatus TaxID=83455 RepID=UPI0030D30B7A
MVGKLAWMALVVAGLSVMLCAGGCSAKAQSEAAPAASSKSTAPQSAPAQPTPAEMSELWNSMSSLRAEVLQLRKEVASLRAQVKAPPPATGGAGAQATPRQGTGGAGAPSTSSPGTGNAGAQATSPQGTSSASAPDAGTGGAGAQASSTTDSSGRARVTATYRGTVHSVIPPEVVIAQEDGSPLTLEVSPRTLVVGTSGERLDVRDLGPGDHVRAVVDMVGKHETVEISVLRKEDASE